MSVSRRDFLAKSAGFGMIFAATDLVAGISRPASAQSNLDHPSGGPHSFHPEFPSQAPDAVRDVVGASHTDLDKVKALVTARPALAKASWDWGFGDWETALGAASHVGRRDIAELLIANGARPSIFSAAMLGQVDVVRAFVLASPGVQRIPGPHGIPLLRHAIAGGEEAKSVVEYLESLGDADQRTPSVELGAKELEPYVGTYGFGNGPDDRFVVTIDSKGSLRVARGDRSGKVLFALGDHAFFPGGADAVRIRFAVQSDKATALSIHDPDVLVTAVRI